MTTKADKRVKSVRVSKKPPTKYDAIKDLYPSVAHDPAPLPRGDLRGWIVDNKRVCKGCASKLMARGHGPLFAGAVPVWNKTRGKCTLCKGGC
jgi:hypothetical protein